MIENNEDRADLGLKALMVASDYPGNDPWTDFTDTVANLRHLADRLGLDWETVVEKVDRTYYGDMEDGPPARRVYDLEHVPAAYTAWPNEEGQ